MKISPTFFSIALTVGLLLSSATYICAAEVSTEADDISFSDTQNVQPVEPSTESAAPEKPAQPYSEIAELKIVNSFKNFFIAVCGLGSLVAGAKIGLYDEKGITNYLGHTFVGLGAFISLWTTFTTPLVAEDALTKLVGAAGLIASGCIYTDAYIKCPLSLIREQEWEARWQALAQKWEQQDQQQRYEEIKKVLMFCS